MRPFTAIVLRTKNDECRTCERRLTRTGQDGVPRASRRVREVDVEVLVANQQLVTELFTEREAIRVMRDALLMLERGDV